MREDGREAPAHSAEGHAAPEARFSQQGSRNEAAGPSVLRRLMRDSRPTTDMQPRFGFVHFGPTPARRIDNAAREPAAVRVKERPPGQAVSEHGRVGARGADTRPDAIPDR